MSSSFGSFFFFFGQEKRNGFSMCRDFETIGMECAVVGSDSAVVAVDCCFAG